ncbi:unnamed protein product [Fusarium fujikuroi]|nr:unnamed protein product [Fusarium fujikuroi]
MKDLGVLLDEIVAREGVTKHAIFRIVRRYQSQISVKDKPRSGHLTILTRRDKTHIEQIVNRFPFIIIQEIKDWTGISCHRSTITRWLKKQGIQHHHALRRPREFAEKYRYEPESFWHTWFFSDEVSIDRIDGDITKWAKDFTEIMFNLAESRCVILRCFMSPLTAIRWQGVEASQAGLSWLVFENSSQQSWRKE